MSNQIDSDSIVGSCDCMTKTNKATHHAKGCKYRLITERDEAREQIVKAKVSLQQVDLPDEPLSIQAERIVEQLQWQIGINHGQANQIDAANNKHREWLELLKELQGALKKCASIISGENMNKNGLIDALESSRSALAKAKEVLP